MGARGGGQAGRGFARQASVATAGEGLQYHWDKQSKCSWMPDKPVASQCTLSHWQAKVFLTSWTGFFLDFFPNFSYRQAHIWPLKGITVASSQSKHPTWRKIGVSQQPLLGDQKGNTTKWMTFMIKRDRKQPWALVRRWCVSSEFVQMRTVSARLKIKCTYPQCCCNSFCSSRGQQRPATAALTIVTNKRKYVFMFVAHHEKYQLGKVATHSQAASVWPTTTLSEFLIMQRSGKTDVSSRTHHVDLTVCSTPLAGPWSAAESVQL